jgi:hypothetical protein
VNPYRSGEGFDIPGLTLLATARMAVTSSAARSN